MSCTKYISKSLKGLSQPPISWAPPGAKQPTVAAGRKHEAPPADKMVRPPNSLLSYFVSILICLFADVLVRRLITVQASPFKKPAPKNIAQTDGTNDEVEDARMKEAKVLAAVAFEEFVLRMCGHEEG